MLKLLLKPFKEFKNFYKKIPIKNTYFKDLNLSIFKIILYFYLFFFGYRYKPIKFQSNLIGKTLLVRKCTLLKRKDQFHLKKKD